MTTKLSLYNGALLECGERNLASLVEAREPRRLLDAVWDAGAVDFCLAQGSWTFAARSTLLESSPSLTPSFGFQNAFEIPADYLSAIAICTDPYFQTPCLQYTVEGGYWFADTDPLYVRYVSNDASYGGDYSLWSPEFVLYVQTYLASRIIERLSQNEAKWGNLYKLASKRLTSAKSKDSMEGPTRFLPPGSWTSARRGGGVSRRDRGNHTGLIG